MSITKSQTVEKEEFTKLLQCDIEPDVRPWRWPRRKKKRTKGLISTQRNLFQQGAKMEIENLIKVIQVFSDKIIAFNRAFVTIGGSINAGLFLSQALYWSRKESVQKNEGWFYKSQSEWEEETGLSRYEQETARKRLRQEGILEERNTHTVPKKLEYKINILAVANSLHSRMGESRTLEWGIPALCYKENQYSSYSSLEEYSENIITHAHASRDAEKGQEVVTKEESSFFEDPFFSENKTNLGFPTIEGLNAPVTDNPKITKAYAEALKKGNLIPMPSIEGKKRTQGKPGGKKLGFISNQSELMMYELCYSAHSDDEIALISDINKKRIRACLRRLAVAGQNLRLLENFREWWNLSWMSGKGPFKQNPRPEQVVDHWNEMVSYLKPLSKTVPKDDVPIEKLIQGMANLKKEKK